MSKEWEIHQWWIVYNIRRWIADRGELGVEGKKDVCAKRQRVESRDNLVASWYTGSWTWRKMKDNRVGNKKLLVA